MSDPFDIVVECDSPEQVLSVLLHINNIRLPDGKRKPFSDMLTALMVEHTEEALLSMVRGKTVRQLLSEYDTSPMPKPLAFGEKDGVKWTLHDPPSG